MTHFEETIKALRQAREQAINNDWDGFVEQCKKAHGEFAAHIEETHAKS